MILPRVFTVQEANALVPLLEERMGRVDRLCADARELHKSLEVSASTATGVAVAEAADAHTSLGAVEDKIQDEVTAVARLGLTVKGLTPPTVDAPALRHGRPVSLCWSLGEASFGHWHPLDRGYDERLPVEDDTDFGVDLLQ